MLIDKYERRHKEFLKANKRLDEVEEALRHLPVRELKEPFYQGWIVSVRLRQDIMNRMDSPILLRALYMGRQKEYINSSLREVKLIRKGIREVEYINWKGQKAMRSLLPNPKYLSVKEYNELTPEIKKYFTLEEFRVPGTEKIYKQANLNIPLSWIEIKARPNKITHQYIKGGPLETERKELRDFLDEYWREFSSNYWKEDRWRDDRTEVRIQTRKFLKGEIEDIIV